MPFRRVPKIEFTLLLIAVALDTFILAYGPGDTLDRRFFYDGISARLLIDSLGMAGCHRYAIAECADLFLISAYTSLLVLLFRRWRPRFLWLGVLTGFLDAYETGTILAVLTGYSPATALDGLGWITAAKWISGAGAVLVLLVPVLRARSEVARREKKA